MLSKGVHSGCYLLDLSSFSAVFFNILKVYLLVQLLLHVQTISFQVKHFECLVLRLIDLFIDYYFELVKLFDDVGLALIEGILHLLKVDLGVQLTAQVVPRFRQLLGADAAHNISPDLLHVVVDLVCFLLMVKFAILNQLVDKLSSLFNIPFAFFLELSQLVFEEHYIITSLL